MVGLETGTGKGVSCVELRGREFGGGVAVGRSQRRHGRGHGEPHWVVAADSALQTISHGEGLQVLACGNAESPFVAARLWFAECVICEHHGGVEG